MFRRMLAVEPGGCAAVRSLQSVAMRQLLCMNPVQPHIQRLLLKRSRVRATQTIAYVAHHDLFIFFLLKRFLKGGLYTLTLDQTQARSQHAELPLTFVIYKPIYLIQI